MNLDGKVVRDFGEEWEKFDFLNEVDLASLRNQFQNYIKPIPKEVFSSRELIAADFGAGTGRWSYFLKDFCKKLYVLEPSEKAFYVSQKRFHQEPKVVLLNESVEQNSIPDNTLDLAISLGVLHHIPDTQSAIASVCRKIKPGGFFLGYLYYALENKPLYYRSIWRLSDFVRKRISRFPKKIKFILAELIAITLYFPLARLSKLVSKIGISSGGVPLHHYKNLSFTVMRNDALDRFGTTLEQRFTKQDIEKMLTLANFDISTLKFSDSEPFWTFAVQKRS